MLFIFQDIKYERSGVGLGSGGDIRETLNIQGPLTLSIQGLGWDPECSGSADPEYSGSGDPEY